jgi:hypothetical protein
MSVRVHTTVGENVTVRLLDNAGVEPLMLSLAEVRDGTGWPAGVRFLEVEP